MAPPLSAFRLELFHGVWRVTFNGRFFGDYRSEGVAREGIAEAQRALAAPKKIERRGDK
ncbi:MAG: hypothetical protein AB7Q23_08740 [Hyphomonadaceae bacterium]